MNHIFEVQGDIAVLQDGPHTLTIDQAHELGRALLDIVHPHVNLADLEIAPADQEDMNEVVGPRSAESVRAMFIAHIKQMVDYWASDTVARETVNERLSGLAFSILTAIDGHAAGFPCAIDMRLAPHPSDRQSSIDDGEDWFQDGQLINDVMLHDEFYAEERAANKRRQTSE